MRGIVYAVIGELIVFGAVFASAAYWFMKNWLGF
jgi:hypothetical protein